MYLPTWLVFAFLTVSAFAPVAGRWSGWWIVYYGALLICWVFVSGAAFRKAARARRMRQRKLARLFRQHRDEERSQLEHAGARKPPMP
jgi:threonine/homoserine/homoserine lactone efflux protein